VKTDPYVTSVMLSIQCRKSFLPFALENWKRQTYPYKHLVVVTDYPAPARHSSRDITFVQLSADASIGRKLNCAISLASTDFIQKIDDDDFYHAELLEESVRAFPSEQADAFVNPSAYTALLLKDFKFHDVGPGLRAGTSMFFPRRFWKKAGFREDSESGKDWIFHSDHGYADPVGIDCRRKIVVVRHGLGHVWLRRQGNTVEGSFATYPEVPNPLPPRATAFYKRLQKEID
jgi:glycosyltransferase involved in cell wall biosynthesis